MDKQLGFRAIFQKRKIRTVHWRSQRDKPLDALVRTTHTQTDPRTEAEPSQQQGYGREFRRKKVQRGADILLLANAAVMCAGAQARSAKIEAKDRQPHAIQSFCQLIDNF